MVREGDPDGTSLAVHASRSENKAGDPAMIVSDRPKTVAIRLRFQSDVGRIPVAVDHVMRFVRLSGCVLGQEIEVEMALREALDNAVVHGNRSVPDKWVYVRCRCDPDDGVSIVVRDEGQGFDPAPVADATTRGGIASEHGMGLLIMRSYMDEVSFEQGGTEVHLRKPPAIVREMWSQRPDDGAQRASRVDPGTH
jgi:Anti-sigma regulatory factor (Ser/Thr protein kinase)